jgi:hypothetical protein
MRLVDNHRFWGPAARLVRERRGEFPDDFASGIEKRFRVKCLQNMGLIRRQVELLNAFRAEGVEVTFFKGPVLAQRLFGNQDTRFSHDIDVLVRTGEVVRADSLMRRLGYQRMDPAIRDGDLPVYYSRHKHVGYLHSADRTFVEIHSRLRDKWLEFPVPSEVVARHRIEVDLFGCRIPTFDDGFLLAYLSLHASDHYLRRLFWLADVYVLSGLIEPARRGEVMELAKSFRCGRRLALCQQLGASMADLSGNVRLPGFRPSMGRFVFGVWSRTHEKESDDDLFQSFRERMDLLAYELHLMGGAGRQALFLATKFFIASDRDLEMLRLPVFLHWLYQSAEKYPLGLGRATSFSDWGSLTTLFG